MRFVSWFEARTFESFISNLPSEDGVLGEIEA